MNKQSKYDIIVVGGGFAGVAAAAAAASLKKSVLLIEKSSFLGGAACNCYVNPFMPYHIKINGKNKHIAAGLFDEILDRLDRMGGLHKNKVTFNEEVLKIALDRMMNDYGVNVLFHSLITEVEKSDTHINSVTVAGKSGFLKFEADYFIDATGDANLASLAGCPYVLGRESDNLCQPMTLCFRISNVDVAKAFENSEKINALYKKFRNEGKIKNPREDVLKFGHFAHGVLHLNSTRIIKKSPIDVFDLSKAEIEAREQMWELFNFLKNNCEGFEDCTLLSSAPEIGIRESRKIKGKYTITADDVKNCTKFADSIAACNYDIDIHNPDGSGTSHYFFKEGTYYTIPYRSLIPENTDNLLAAGRCISATHEAQASLRIMPIVCCIGHAAGTAAAVAHGTHCDVSSADIKLIQKILKENGAFF